ncbi:MAG: rRNA maturation RNase YbeY [Rhodospirillales bacterium]|nr:rRNA maturation RNase YbeY [Rhodospirillales bacterium]
MTPNSAPEGLDIAVATNSPQWDTALPDVQALARTAVEAAWAAGQGVGAVQTTEVSIVLADDAFVQNLNRDFRGQDKPTNVLAFPASGGGMDEGPTAQPPGMPVLLGDIVVAFETAMAEAADQGKALGDHVCHLVVHGMLHLLGFDHQVAADADVMEALEIDVLAGLHIANPYEGGVAVDGSTP